MMCISGSMLREIISPSRSRPRSAGYTRGAFLWWCLIDIQDAPVPPVRPWLPLFYHRQKTDAEPLVEGDALQAPLNSARSTTACQWSVRRGDGRRRRVGPSPRSSLRAAVRHLVFMGRSRPHAPGWLGTPAECIQAAHRWPQEHQAALPPAEPHQPPTDAPHAYPADQRVPRAQHEE